MIITEYFKRGTQPTEVSERYSKLNDITNSDVKVFGNTATISWNLEIPTYLSDEYLNEYLKRDSLMVSHSDVYRTCYQPHYRVLLKECAEKLMLKK